MSKDEIEYRAYLFFREKGLEYVDNIDELIEYCREFAFQFVSYFEQQIEKMKCCQNCKFEDNDYMEKPCCECSRSLGDIKRKGTSDKWEIKENDR